MGFAVGLVNQVGVAAVANELTSEVLCRFFAHNCYTHGNSAISSGRFGLPADFNPFKSLDKYFLSCKIVTLLLCLPWPFTLLASVMSLAGQFQPETPMYLKVLVRLGWLLVLGYPVIFFAVVLLAEKVLAPKNYPAGAVVAILPTVCSLLVGCWIFLK